LKVSFSTFKLILEPNRGQRVKTSNEYGSKMNNKIRNIMKSSNSHDNRNRREKIREGSKGDRGHSRQPKSDINPMTRNYKTLMKMNNTAVPNTKDNGNKNIVPRNVFTDYTAGCNMSEYKDLLSNSSIGNSTIQWVLRLRQNFAESMKKHGKVDIADTSSHANQSRYGKAPS
jgi:hypothetical protein